MTYFIMKNNPVSYLITRREFLARISCYTLCYAFHEYVVIIDIWPLILVLFCVFVFMRWQGYTGKCRGDAVGFRDGELHQPLGDQED